MKKKIVNNFLEKINCIKMDPVVILKPKYGISLLAAISIASLYYFDLVDIKKSVLSDVITFLSIMIAVIGMVLSVTVAIREGKTYKEILELDKSIIINYYKTIKESVLYSIAVIVLCLLILIFHFETSLFVKIMITTIGVFLFCMSVISSITAFLVSFTIMHLDDKER